MVDVIKKYNKVIISVIAVLAIFAVLPFVVKKGTNSLTERQRRLMRYDQVQDGEEAIDGTDYVTFDAFFLEDLDNDGNADGLRGTEAEIGSTPELYFDLRVTGDVKLINGQISFVNSNVSIGGTIKKGSLVPNNTSVNGTAISLNELNPGFSTLQALVVKTNLTNDIKSYSGINKIVLTGTVTDLNGNVITDITKEVSYTVDWHGDSLSASISGSGKFDEPRANTAHKVVYNVTSRETEGQLFLKDTNLEATISKVNGKDPVSVRLIGNSVSDVNWSYDAETRKLTAKREAVLDGTLITTPAYSYKNSLTSYNDWKIEVIYPWSDDDDRGFATIYLKTWYTAFNNEEGNPDLTKTSNVAQTTLSANYYTRHPAYVDPIDHDISMSVGKASVALGKNFVEKTEATSIYNGAELEDSKTDYRVTWSVYVPSDINDGNKGGNDYTIVLDDNNGEKLNNSVSIKDYVTYKTISFTDLADTLNSTGTITLIDADTEEVLHVFTSLDWNTPYTFEGETRSIKLSVNGFQYKPKTHDFNNFRYQSLFHVNIVKTINNNAIAEGIPYAEFENYGTITSRFNLQGYNGSELMTIYGKTTNYALADASYANASSQAYISLSKSQVNTIEDPTNPTSDLNINIRTNSIDDVSKAFKNGEFLVIVPKEILHINIKNISSSIDDVNVVGYEVGKLADGREFIKVLTENTISEEKKYTLTLETEVVLDPTVTDGTGVFKLYAYNPNCHNYLNGTADIYDVNGNNDVEEKVSYTYTSLKFVAPNEIITTSMLTNYSESGSTTVAPLIAEVNPIEDDAEAKVEISLTNNSRYSAKNIRVIGKVAYDDNTYQIGGGSLGSEYDVQMTADGITYPSEIEGNVTIYYSEEETPTEDLTNPANGWKLKDATDFSKVKSYMIILDDYIMDAGHGLLFSYEVEMPMTTANINKVTYFTHGVYYDLETDAGLYSSSVGGAKLGIRMSRQYDLELTNLKKAGERPIAGSTYILTDEDGNQKILSTDRNGKTVAKDLYVDKEYKLIQLNVNSPYILDEEEKTIKIINDTNNNLVNSTTGTFKTNDLASDKKLVLVHENETKYTVVLKDTDIDTNLPINKSTFTITGKGYESGKTLRTNYDGELTLKNLYLDEIYTIEQTSINDYLLTDQFTIKLTRDNNGIVRIIKGKVPTAGEMVSYSENGYIKGESGLYYLPVGKNAGIHYNGYIPIDMTGLSGTYKLKVKYQFTSYNSSNSFKLYLTDNPDHLGSAFKTENTSNSSRTKTAETSYYQFWDQTYSYSYSKNITGGKTYYLAADFYYSGQGGYASYGYVYIPELELVNGESFEYVVTDETENVEIFENKTATQSLVDNDNLDAPVLTVNVKNAKIPKYTLNITKKDADSGEVLAGAQYKITGPGLPETGKYITTDENGKASVELYKEIYHDNDYINGFNYRQYESDYIIQEVLAPVGYTLDKKSVSFKVRNELKNGEYSPYRIKNGSDYYLNYITNLDEETNNILIYDLNSEKSFKEYSWDGNSLNVIMEDYPIITVVKKDAETGELLPNTLFAVFEINSVNGNLVLTPALDPQGNTIGDETIVDGKTYYAVATDENGKLTINLGSGQYMLKEIQAADEKYKIDGTEYYFGVGETVPYKPASVELVEAVTPPNNYFNNTDRYTSDVFKATSDGGFIMVSVQRHILVKYDANYNVEWQTNTQLYGSYEYEFNYFDNPTRKDVMTYGGFSADFRPYDVMETSDGGFVISTQAYGIFAKYDKDGNLLWSHRNVEGFRFLFDHYLPYEGNTDENGNLNPCMYNSTTGEWEIDTSYTISPESVANPYNNWHYSKRDDDTYYCHLISSAYDSGLGEYDYISSSSYQRGVVQAPDGGIFILRSNPNVYVENDPNRNYTLKLADGTYKPVTSREIILWYDKDGNLIDYFSLSDLIINANQAYMDKYDLTESIFTEYDLENERFGFVYDEFRSVEQYPNGDILLLMPEKPKAIKIRFNESERKFETIFYSPIGINGYSHDSYYNYGSGYIDIKLKEDGGFTIIDNYYYNYRIPETPNSSYSSYLDTEMQYLDLETDNVLYRSKYDESTTMGGILEYDSTGKLKNFVIACLYSRSETSVNNLGYEDYKHIYMYPNGISYLPLEDGGYIVGNDSRIGIWNYQGHTYDVYSRVELANGEVINISPQTTYMLYKVNKDGYVEWIKQYTGIQPIEQSNYESYNIRLLADGKRFVLPVKVNGYMAELGSDTPLIENYGGQKFLVFELKDEVTPSGPEAYTLNIENKRKEYKITSTSNVGGTIKVTKPDGNEETINNGTIETVKYGDDNVNTITITPEAGYVIASVKVNGEDATYTVNDDGSVTLDTIKDIKENKSINVTFEYGKSTVIVKHYLNGTTDSVFSDEIITGTITSPYSVNPKSSELYSVASENGEIILPDNMTGTFKVEPQTVIFYYVENEVELRVNYYVDGTDTELAPTNVERKVLRSTYQTAPLEITNYELTRTIGEESGTLTRDVTEVTYMYQESTESKITIRYVDKDTNKDIIDPIVKTVTRHEPYTTDDEVTIPAKYRYTSVSGVPSGTADDASIEVIYYYEVIPFNISVDKKINSLLLNGEKQTIIDGKNVSISPKKKDNLIVYYEIEVKNTGDIPATFKVEEGDIPGFEIYDIGEFTKVGDNYVLDVELQPGDSKTYKIGYKWNQKDYGISTNKVEINEVTGVDGYPEPDTDDNKSTATVETKIPKEVIPDTIIIPDTVDKIMTSIMIFIGSLIGILTSIILIKKKRMNN